MLTSQENKDPETVEPIQENSYQSNTYRKDSSWLYFYDDPRFQERQQVLDQQFYIHFCVTNIAYPSSN